MEASRVSAKPVIGRTGRRQSLLADVRAAVATDVPFLVTIGSYVAAVALLHVATDVPSRYSLAGNYQVIASWVAMYALPTFVGYVVYRFFAKGESIRGGHFWAAVRSRLLSPGATVAFAIIILLLPYWIRSFVAMKAAVPEIQPFVWDVRLMEWDRALHFGVHPWLIIQPIVGTPVVSGVIDFLYRAWFPVMWMTFMWQAWHAPRTSLRSQFLLSFALCWIILGSALAIVFSSAGPIYYGAVVGEPDPFVPLVDYLRAASEVVPMHVLDTSEALWTSYIDPEANALGISAMPSLHVAVVVLMTILGFRTHRWLGWAYAVFAGVIFVGSVHLAWHYAIDGYLAAFGTVAIWVLSGQIVERWETYRARRVTNRG